MKRRSLIDSKLQSLANPCGIRGIKHSIHFLTCHAGMDFSPIELVLSLALMLSRKHLAVG